MKKPTNRHCLKGVARFLALSLTLSLPNPAFALHQTEPTENAGLEQEIFDALASGDPNRLLEVGKTSLARLIAAPEPPPAAGLEETVDRAALESKLITEWDLDFRAINHLEKSGIQTVGDLLKLSEDELQTALGARAHKDSFLLAAIKWELAREGIALQSASLPSGPLIFDRTVLKNIPIERMWNHLGRTSFVGLRARKGIHRANVQTVGELLGRSASEIRVRNFGGKSLEAVRRAVIQLVVDQELAKRPEAAPLPVEPDLMTEAVERFHVEPDPGKVMQNVGYLLEGEGIAFVTPLALLEAGKILNPYSFAGVVETRQDKERLIAIVATNADARKLIEERLIVVEEQDGESLAARYERARELASRLLWGTEIRTVSTLETNLLDQLNRLLAVYGYRLPKDPLIQRAARTLLQAA